MNFKIIISLMIVLFMITSAHAGNDKDIKVHKNSFEAGELAGYTGNDLTGNSKHYLDGYEKGNQDYHTYAESKIINLTNQINELNNQSEIDRLNDIITNLTTEIEEHKQALINMSNEHNATINIYENEINRLNNEIDRLNNEVNSSLEEIDRLKSLVDFYESEANRLQIEVDRLTALLLDYESQIETLTLENERLNEYIILLESNINDTDGLVQYWIDRYDDMVESMQQKYDDMVIYYEGLISQMKEDHADEITQLENDCDEASMMYETEIILLEDRIVELETEIDLFECDECIECDECVNDITALEVEIKDLKEQLKEANDRIDELIEYYENLITEIRDNNNVTEAYNNGFEDGKNYVEPTSEPTIIPEPTETPEPIETLTTNESESKNQMNSPALGIGYHGSETNDKNPVLYTWKPIDDELNHVTTDYIPSDDEHVGPVIVTPARVVGESLKEFDNRYERIEQWYNN